jgi:hypothetical protein
MEYLAFVCRALEGGGIEIGQILLGLGLIAMHNLAKVGVEGWNPFARSRLPK